MHAHVQNRIMAELQGACIGRNGYVIVIFPLDNDSITTGLVDLDTGALNVTGNEEYISNFLSTQPPSSIFLLTHILFYPSIFSSHSYIVLPFHL